jgi:transcriptional regulator of acetoin/glycerol metabolism
VAVPVGCCRIISSIFSFISDEYERRQRDETIRALTACKGRVGGTDGAAASLEMNRATFLSRMKKFGIYAKQYA